MIPNSGIAPSPEPRRLYQRDYLLLALGGLLGAVFGAIQDGFVSFPLSAEYFGIGKELLGGEGLRGRATLLGFGAGIGPGALAAAVFLHSGRRPGAQPCLEHARLARFFVWPVASAVVCGATFGVFLSDRDPMRFRPILESLIPSERVDPFLRVWWIHVGLYLGFVLGVIGGAVAIFRMRKRYRPRSPGFPSTRV